MPNNQVFVDPSLFNPINLFVIMLVDGRQSIPAWAIKWDTGGNYNHTATIRKAGLVDSQDMFFHEVSLNKYMVSGNMLKFWVIKDLTIDEWNIINTAIQNDINLPPWKRFYNYLGIVGQFLRLPWISFPGTYFCSERVSKYLRLIPRLDSILPENVSPAFDDTVFVNHPELMICLGYWWQD